MPTPAITRRVQWLERNHTYTFANGLGGAIVLFGLLLCLHPWLPQLAAVGGFLGLAPLKLKGKFSHK